MILLYTTDCYQFLRYGRNNDYSVVLNFSEYCSITDAIDALYRSQCHACTFWLLCKVLLIVSILSLLKPPKTLLCIYIGLEIWRHCDQAIPPTGVSKTSATFERTDNVELDRSFLYFPGSSSFKNRFRSHFTDLSCSLFSWCSSNKITSLSDSNIPKNRISRWQWTQHMLEEFWKI